MAIRTVSDVAADCGRPHEQATSEHAWEVCPSGAPGLRLSDVSRDLQTSRSTLMDKARRGVFDIEERSDRDRHKYFVPTGEIDKLRADLEKSVGGVSRQPGAEVEVLREECQTLRRERDEARRHLTNLLAAYHQFLEGLQGEVGSQRALLESFNDVVTPSPRDFGS